MGGYASLESRPVFTAHRSMSGQFQQGRPLTAHLGSGSRPRSFHIFTVWRWTPMR